MGMTMSGVGVKVDMASVFPAGLLIETQGLRLEVHSTKVAGGKRVNHKSAKGAHHGGEAGKREASPRAGLEARAIQILEGVREDVNESRRQNYPCREGFD